jgi:hypothetical protein
MNDVQNHEATFTDELYEWMERAPWVALSLTMHGLILLILALIPWHLFSNEEAPIFEARIRGAAAP